MLSEATKLNVRRILEGYSNTRAGKLQAKLSACYALPLHLFQKGKEEPVLTRVTF